jgi:cobalt-zinc-cadmium efflux system protein
MTKRMAWTFTVSCLLFVLELIGGLLSGSLALLSDAGHVLTDALSLGLSWFALVIARRPPSAKASFGYHRVGILVALLNGTTLVVMSALIVREAVARFSHAIPIHTTELLAIAGVGLIANLVMAGLLHSGHKHSLNVGSAWLHVLGDSLASVGVIAAGLIIRFTGFRAADPIMSVLIAVLILFGGWRVLRKAGRVLLELPPRNLDLDEIARQMQSVPGVVGIHDLHVWSITPQLLTLAAHVQVKDQRLQASQRVLDALNERLHAQGIGHTTLQLECADCGNGDTFCNGLEPAPSDHPAH